MLAASRHRDGPSSIAQLGLFARAAISSGTIVSRVGGSPVTGKELQQIFTAPAQRPDPPYVDTITIGEDLHLVLPPASPTTAATTAATRTYGGPTRTPWPPGDPSRPEKRSPATTQPAPASATSPLPAPGDRHCAGSHHPARTGAAPNCKPARAITGYLPCSVAYGRPETYSHATTANQQTGHGALFRAFTPRSETRSRCRLEPAITAMTR